MSLVVDGSAVVIGGRRGDGADICVPRLYVGCTDRARSTRSTAAQAATATAIALAAGAVARHPQAAGSCTVQA